LTTHKPDGKATSSRKKHRECTDVTWSTRLSLLHVLEWWWNVKTDRLVCMDGWVDGSSTRRQLTLINWHADHINITSAESVYNLH